MCLDWPWITHNPGAQPACISHSGVSTSSDSLQHPEILRVTYRNGVAQWVRWLHCGLDNWGTVVPSMAAVTLFSCPKRPHRVRSSQPRIQRVPWGKAARARGWPSAQSSAEVKSEKIYASPAPTQCAIGTFSGTAEPSPVWELYRRCEPATGLGGRTETAVCEGADMGSEGLPVCMPVSQ